MDTLGLTSRWVAAARARESARADRLFNDPLAAALAGKEGRDLLEEMERVTAILGDLNESPQFAIRTRFFDDALMAAAGQGARQIVILAAGMDTRAFRLEWPEGTTVFEVERDEVLRCKESVLEASAAQPRAKRVVVPADLLEDWPSELRKVGHDPARATVFLVEGLLPYLAEEAAAVSILSSAAAIATSGSSIALDAVGKSLLTSAWVKAFLDVLEAKGAPWHFGTDEPEALLERAGWSDACATRLGEYGASLGRWPFAVQPRRMPGAAHSFLVLAWRF